MFAQIKIGQPSESSLISTTPDYGTGKTDFVTSANSDIAPGNYEYQTVDIQGMLRAPKGSVRASVVIKANKRITIGPNARIDFTGMGNPPSTKPSKTADGGSHGGTGGLGKCVGNSDVPSYSNKLTDAVSFGQSGSYLNGSTNSAGFGGGYIRLEAPEIVVDGKLIADGTEGVGDGGGGAGGMIVLLSPKLTINGFVSANGGKGGSSFVQGAGGGGGGVIMIPDIFNNRQVLFINGGHGGMAFDIYSGCDGQSGHDGVIVAVSTV